MMMMKKLMKITSLMNKIGKVVQMKMKTDKMEMKWKRENDL